MQKHYQYQSFIYKIGLHGMVFVKTINGWMRSTVSRAELEHAEKQRLKRTSSAMKNASDFRFTEHTTSNERAQQ